MGKRNQVTVLGGWQLQRPLDKTHLGMFEEKEGGACVKPPLLSTGFESQVWDFPQQVALGEVPSVSQNGFPLCQG